MITSVLSGNDVTESVQEGSITLHHNAPDQASIAMPFHTVPGSIDIQGLEGVTLDIYEDGSHKHHGNVEYAEADGDADEIRVVFHSIDPTFIYKDRLVQDADGDYTKPTIIEDNLDGPAIMAAAHANTVATFGSVGFGVGAVATGGISLEGAPTNWPKYIDELGVLLCETGQLDITYDPATNLVSFWNGDYGSDLSGSVQLHYGTGNFNCYRGRMSVDKKELKNRIRYLLGPRVGTSDDPAGDQHWRGSVDLTTVSIPNHSAVNALAAASEAAHLCRFELRIFDARGDEATVGRELYKAHFSSEVILRAQPKLMFHVTPDPGMPLNFGSGDLISVAGFGISGVQRVMDVTGSWKANGPLEVGEPSTQAGSPRPFAVTTTGVMEAI